MNDAALSLIQRLVNANNNARSEAVTSISNDTDTDTIINEMREFLLLEHSFGNDINDTDAGNESNATESQSLEICITFGEKEQERVLRAQVFEPELINAGDDDDNENDDDGGDDGRESNKNNNNDRFFDVDLSSHEYIIGDVGCSQLLQSLLIINCNNISSSIYMRTLDLEANGLSAVSGTALATAISSSFHRLEHLNLGCNSIGAYGCQQLAPQLHHLTHLDTLDLHGNGISDQGCLALAACLPKLKSLKVLDLSANRIEDAGATALSVLFKDNCCPLLTSLNLGENGIESISALVLPCGKTAPLLELQALNLSWNSIVAFDALLGCRFPNLAEIDLRGNALSDQECVTLCSKLTDHRLDYDDESPPKISLPSESRLRVSLRLLADDHATNDLICQLPLWNNNYSKTHNDRKEDRLETKAVTGGTDPSEDAFLNLRRDGYVIQATRDQDMGHLCTIMNQIEHAGYPPVFCFMNDAFWNFITAQVWPMVSSLFGVGDSLCLLDSGSAFAWSLKSTGKSTFPRDGEFRSWQNAVSSINSIVPKEKQEDEHRGLGSSFGLPHRDYSAADSLYCDDEPAVLTVWIPLNDATNNNGCIYVVPREFDTDFSRTDGHHAHMNPAAEVQRGVSSKIHFPLHGVRALPAPAGSLIAWYGNTIHWGSSCSKYAKDPRKSIALTFVRGKIGQLSTTTTDDNGPKVHNPSPPISLIQATDMTTRMRLSLISRSLLLYNQWHALADDAVPAAIYETTTVLKKN